MQQVTGIDAWLGERPLQPSSSSREVQTDWRWAMERRQRERDAMVAHIERQEAADGNPARAVAAKTVLIVHRHQWFAGRLSQALADDDTAVPYVSPDGAAGIGIMVAEQPDVVVIEDRLSSVTAVDFVTRARVLAPRTALTVQITTAQAATEVLAAGASAVFTHRAPPADAAQHVKALLAAGAGPMPLA